MSEDKVIDKLRNLSSLTDSDIFIYIGEISQQVVLLPLKQPQKLVKK